MIRRIEKADKEIYMEFAKDFYSSDAVDHTVPESHFEAAFNEFFRSSDYLEGYILEYEYKPVGYGIISKTFSPEAGGVVIWIEELYLLDEYRSKGLGRDFFEHLEQKAISEKITRQRLEISPSNERAKKLYMKMGFKELDYKQMVKDYK